MTTLQKSGLEERLIKLQEVLNLAEESEKLMKAMINNATHYGFTNEVKHHYLRQAKVYDLKAKSLFRIFDRKLLELSALTTVLHSNQN
jgi:hypothetical protein